MNDKLRIRRKAMEIGFDAVGFAPPEVDERDRARLGEFILNREYGDMVWMARNADVRMDPKALWPDVKSVVVLGLNYAPAPEPGGAEERGAGRISVYARNRDYHDIVKRRLKRLASWMADGFDCRVKIFTDTAPVLEKALASKAGIGWFGKHTNIVSRKFGSWLFLGEIFTDLEIEADAPEKSRCGSCERCMSACPTGAITAPCRLDPRRCVSYLTIEHKGSVPEDFHEAIGNRVYGCDECLLACPWNRFAPTTAETGFLPRPDLIRPLLADLLELDDPGFRRFFSGSPIKRIGSERFLRNARISLENDLKRRFL